MNKNFYKTIFSKTRGEMIAVAENVSAEGQSAHRTVSTAQVQIEAVTEKSLCLKVLSFSMMLWAGTAVLVTPVTLTNANVVADPNAAGNQRPTIMNSANGITQVNIQTPTQSGVSMNQYQQFDVNQQGVILNNSRQNTQTQLAGYIQANPWLAGGEAKVIVNQVNSTQASQLNGYIEVGGKKADVIIANTAGIRVDGGGFINAGGVTLTTGNPILDQGNLTGFQIRDGLINITGQGLDTSGSDYTRLLSHAAQINAGIWAKDLKIVTGQNDIDQNDNISIAADAQSLNKPQFAIDTGSLGGMYAGKISLISTEKGVGINNAGQVFASAGNIKISADGQLQNSGSVVAQHTADPTQATLDIQAKELNNSGSISSLAKQSIHTDQLTNTGLIATSAELNIRNTAQISNEGELNAGRIDIETQTLKNQSGQIVQTGLQDLVIESGTLLNSANALIGYTEVDTSTGSGSSGGATGGNNTNNEAPTTATGGGGTTSANTSMTTSYVQGRIKANTVENEQGQITANGGIDLTASQALTNAGTLNLNRLVADGTLLQNTGILSSQTLQAKVDVLKNNQGQIYVNSAEIQANSVDNQQGIIQAQDTLNIQANQALNNQLGQITAQTSIVIHDNNQNTMTVDNSQAGKILSAGDIQIQSGRLLHADQSELIANHDIQLKQKEHFTVDSAIQAGNQISIENDTGITNNSLLEAGSQLNMTANEIKNNQQAIIQANATVHLSATNQIENTGLINSNGLTWLEAGNTLQNLGTGQIYGDHIALQTKQLLNAEQQTAEGMKSAVIAARERLDIAAQQIENREQALLSSENQLAVGGQLNQNHFAEGAAQSLDNASARIQSAGDMYLGVNTLSNRNLHFSSSVKEVPDSREQVIAYQGSGSSEILDASHVTGWGGQETVYLDGQRYEDYTKYDYTRYETQDYVDSSAPAYIVSGGTLTLDGQNLSNDKSQILAAQGINILQNDVDNIDAEGEHRVIQTGTTQYHYVGWNSLGTKKKSEWDNPKPYNPADIVTPIKLDVVKYDGAYQGNNGGLNPTQIQSVQTESVDGKTDGEIRTITPDLSLPNQSLFSINKDNNNEPLIETNSAFTQYKKWLGSDYMLNMLSTDPANMHKRLGDGYYEQKLVNDQIAQLTGKVYLDGYSNYEEQFKALMDAGISAAKNMSLTPGVALSQAQIARLTSDIVWMVTETVTLADGQKVEVLVPKVYVLVQPGDLNGQGTLIAANMINMQLKGDLNNSGTIAGRQLVNLNGNNINNVGGLIQGGEIFAQAKNNINNLGGQIQADKTLLLAAGNNINSSSTTIKTENKQGSSEFTAENIGRVAGLYVTGQDGQLVAQAKNDINLKASDLQSEGSVSLQAGNDLNLSTVNVSRKDLSSAGDDDYVMHASSTDVGTQIQAKNDIYLQSGGAISIQAGAINSQDGNVVIDATNGLSITEGWETSAHALRTHEQRSNAVSSSRKDNLLEERENLAVASVISGKQIVLNSGQDLTIQGSNVVSDDLTQIQAKENVSIIGAENQYLNYSESSVKNSGLMSSGGIGFSVGKKSEVTEQQNTQKTNTGSMVGSLKGDTNIIAGKTYQQTGSTVSSQSGDVNILAQQVNIEAAKEQSNNDYKHEMEQKGLTLAVNVPVVTAVQSVVDSAKQVGQSKNDRVNAMAAANAGFDAYQAGQSLAQLKDAVSGASNLAEAANVSVSITYGEQKNTDFSHSENNTASQSQVNAGGKTNIVATGAGEQSNINIIGSDVVGMQGTHLAADHNVNIKAAEQNSKEESGNKSAGWNAGIAVSYGANGLAFGVTAGGNAGKGTGNGTETSYVNSHIGSKDSLTTISSGNATNIIGGQVQGKGVQIDANELNVESLQDKATYKSKQQNIEGQVTVGYGASVSGSFSKSNIDANYASVNEQSGIFAGDDGYQINVKNNTDLKGAIITSTQKAEDLKKNSLDTGTLTYSDIQNVSEYDAEGISVGGSVGINGRGSQDVGGIKLAPQGQTNADGTANGFGKDGTKVSKSVGFGLDSDKDSSITKSGINTQNVMIRDEQAQQSLTGKTADQIKSEILTDVTTDTARENSGALKNNFDKDKVQSEINLQVEVTKNFDANRQEAKAEINKKIDDAKKETQSILDKQEQGLELTAQEEVQLKAYNDKVEDYQKLGILLDSVSAGLSTPTASGLGIAFATLNPSVSYEIGQYFKSLASQNVDGKLTTGQEAAHILAHTVLGAAVAAASGNNALTAGISAGGAEAAAPILSQFLYSKEAKDLTADEKSTISAITGLVASGISATTGNIGSTVQGGQVAQNATEDNYLTQQDIKAMLQELYNAKTEVEEQSVYEKYAKLSKEKSDEAKVVCQDVTSAACQQIVLDIQQGLNFINDQDAILNYKNYEMQKPQTTSNLNDDSEDLHLDIIKFVGNTAEDYKNQTDVRFVEYENLYDLGKYSSSEISNQINDYLGTKDFEYTNQSFLDKPWGSMYVEPSLQMVGGAVTVAGGAVIGGTLCETVVGCVVAGYLVSSGSDDVLTGVSNWGQSSNEHQSTLREQLLQSLGMSENSAAWTSLGLDLTTGLGAAKIVLKSDELAGVVNKYPDEISGFEPSLEPEADFANKLGNVRDATKGTLTEHMVLADISKSGKNIYGGHDINNFTQAINENNGTILSRIETSKDSGIYQVEYVLPASTKPQLKTVYDPVKYPDMAYLVNAAAQKALMEYQFKGYTGTKVFDIDVGGIKFKVPVNPTSKNNLTPTVPTVFPIGVSK